MILEAIKELLNEYKLGASGPHYHQYLATLEIAKCDGGGAILHHVTLENDNHLLSVGKQGQ